jgi:hypothetical protein
MAIKAVSNSFIVVVLCVCKNGLLKGQQNSYTSLTAHPLISTFKMIPVLYNENSSNRAAGKAAQRWYVIP